MQLFTVHALIDHHALPLVYILLQSKTQTDYERVLRKLLELENMLAPTSILMDFEKAIIQAAQAVFPAAALKGCLFHLGQSLWRKIQSEGLVTHYWENEAIRMFMKMLLALSFIPTEDIPGSFDELNDNHSDELEPIYNYWEDTYIERLRCNRRSAPTFAVEFWNMRSRVADGLPRTNNSVEGWHHAFQSAVSCHHPSFYRLLPHLQKEQDNLY